MVFIQRNHLKNFVVSLFFVTDQWRTGMTQQMQTMNLNDLTDSIMGVRTHSTGTRLARHLRTEKGKEIGLVQIFIHIPDLRINTKTTRTTSKIRTEKPSVMFPCGSLVLKRSKHYPARAPRLVLALGRVVNQRATVDRDREARAQTHTAATRVARFGRGPGAGTARATGRVATQRRHRVRWEDQSLPVCVCEIYQQDQVVSFFKLGCQKEFFFYLHV